MANHNTQRYHSMRDAYSQVYLKEGLGKALPILGKIGKGVGKAAKSAMSPSDDDNDDLIAKGSGTQKESVSIMPMRAPMVVKQTTNIDLELTPEYKGPGEVTKAYYTYPAGFDPSGRQDVVKGSETDGSKSRSEKKVEEEYVSEGEEYSDLELVCDKLLDEGLVDSPESAEAFWNHMSDEWRETLLSELNCWKGYKRVKGKAPGTPGSCTKEELDAFVHELVAEGHDLSAYTIDDVAQWYMELVG